MHDTIPEFSRSYRRSLQGRNKETAAEQTMREYFEQNSLRGWLEHDLDDFEIRMLNDPAGFYNLGAGVVAPMPVRGAHRGQSATSATIPVQSNPAGASSSSVSTSASLNVDVIVPESEDEDWSTDFEEEISMGIPDESVDKSEHHHHVITRMMFEEARIEHPRPRVLGALCDCLPGACLHRKPKSVLNKVRECEDPMMAAFKGSAAASATSAAGAKKSDEGDSKMKGIDDAPPNFRWVEIEIK